MPTDREALLEAVNDLIHDPDPRLKKDALDAIAPVAKLYPVRLAGEMKVLNPLVVLRNTDQTAWEAVKKLIDKKRELGSLPVLWPEPGKPKFDIREYQRQLMAQIRERTSRACELENLQRSDRDRLIGNARLEFMRQTGLAWGKRRDALLASAAADAGRKLTKPEQDAIRDTFWATVDRELDERESAIRLELLKPVHQRRKI